MSQTALRLGKKKPTPATTPVITPSPAWQGPDLTPAILDGTESFPDSSVNTQLATAEDLEKVTAESDKALEDAQSGIVRETSFDRIKWFGKVHEFAQFVENAHSQSHFGGISLEKAFTQAAEHYIQSNGKPFDPHSLRESLRQIRDKRKGDL